MVSRRQYPGFAHAVLLCLLVLGFQAGFGLPLAILQSILKIPIAQNPLALGVVNLVDIGLVITIGMMIGKVRLQRSWCCGRSNGASMALS